MTRRGFIVPALGALGLGGLVSGCSPLSLLNTLGPRDPGVRRVVRYLAYGSDPRQRFDLYAPTRPAPAGGWPVIVFFYGGSWDSGSRDVYAWAAQSLSARGFLVAVPDYRLVPQVVFPAFVEDAAAAVARVFAVARDHGGDPGRLALLGHSAGAYLAAMVTLDRRYLAAAGAPEVIRACVGLAGPYDFAPFDVPASINAFGQAPDPTLTQPITFARGDAPPLWLAHGQADDTVRPRNSIVLDRRIRDLGGRSELKLYPGLGHADMIAVFSPLFRRKAPVLDDAVGFLNRALA